MFIPRIDEQIKVGTTQGLVANATSFTFDGSVVGLKDYRGYEISISEINNRGFLIKGLDITWNYTTGRLDLLQPGDFFHLNTYYNVSFQNPVVPAEPVDVNSIVTLDYFVRDIQLANIDASKVGNAASVQKLNLFIQKYEQQCLTKILGYGLYKKVLNESSQRITDLVYGAEFTDLTGNLQIWRGLVRPSELISLIANYIFFYKEEYDKSNTTGSGTIVVKPDVGMIVSPADKMSKAWNFFSEETFCMTDFLWIKTNVDGTRTYPEFTRAQYFETRRISRKIDSIFGF